MATLLLILKIIGIILLCILMLAVLLILIILFVPVRYRIRGSYEDKPYLKAKVTYLLWLLGVTAVYDDIFELILRILIIPIKLIPRKNKPPKNKKDKDKLKGDTKQTSGSNDDKNEATGSEDKDTEFALTEERLGTVDKIKAYAELLSDPETVAAWDVCKLRLGKLLKALVPRHIDIRVRYGLDDPYMTSVIMSVYNVFYIYLGRGLTIEPVYYEKTMSIQAKIRGRIIVAPILWQALMVFINKDCRRFLKRFKNIK